MSSTTSREIYAELRRERLWLRFEKYAVCVVCACVGVLLVGLVGAATIVLMDAAMDAPQTMDDGQ